MKSIDEIERLLGQTPVPCVVEGPHREQLKQRLMAEPLPIPQTDRRVSRLMFSQMSPVVKFAAGVLAAVVLVGAGWAAEIIYEKLTFKQVSLTLEKHPQIDWTLPDGTKMTTAGESSKVINADDPKAAEAAQRHHEEMKELIGQKKYKLKKIFEGKYDGETEYVYTFTFSDGTQDSENFSIPLDNVTSWEDYEQKDREHVRERQEEDNKAIAAGRYRLIDQDIILLQICLDKASQTKLKVQRIYPPKGEAIAFYRPFDITADERAMAKPQSTWQEHLQAIREGKLELLGVETVPMYMYEVILDDGKKRIFDYGGGDPLPAAKAK